MVKDDLDLVLDLKDKEEWVILILIMILMTMMPMLDIKEDLFIENLVVDLKDVDMAKVDLAVTDLKDKANLVVDLKDKGDLVTDLKEKEAMVKDFQGLIGIGTIFEMTSTLQSITIIQFWKMYVSKDKIDKLLVVLMMKVAVPLQIVYFLNFVEETIANTTLVKII